VIKNMPKNKCLIAIRFMISKFLQDKYPLEIHVNRPTKKSRTNY